MELLKEEWNIGLSPNFGLSLHTTTFAKSAIPLSLFLHWKKGEVRSILQSALCGLVETMKVLCTLQTVGR